MLVAFCVSLKLGEEPLRALLYCFIFVTIAITGPGKLSLQYFLSKRNSRSSVPGSRLDSGLLVLRFGAGVSIALLCSLKQAADDFLFVRSNSVWPIALLCIATFLIVCGFKTRIIAVILGACWLWTSCAELFSTQDWFARPVRSVLFVFVFAAVALLGPGSFSLDQRLNQTSGS
jgi:uncharacterized membrane protein YphA (DoxX/SURF4 family)